MCPPVSDAERAVYRLPPPDPKEAEALAAARARRDVYLAEPLLVRNVFWFCRLRWLVVLALFGLAGMGFYADDFVPYGLVLRRDWPLSAALVLAAANTGFMLLARRLTSDNPRRVQGNLWAQIVLDLVVLTVVVHFLGSLESFAPFAYLGHIGLACIFFPRKQSVVVMVLAMALYISCLAVETTGAVAPASIFAPSLLPRRSGVPLVAMMVHLGMALSLWLAVWYLASQLSIAVRLRDKQLAEANRRLVEASEERARHMMRTAHDLKAPFSAIYSHTQLLQEGYCGGLSEKVSEVVEKIAGRCRAIAQQINEMLQLANLESTAKRAPERVELDLADIIGWAVQQIEPTAAERGISVETNLESIRIVTVEDHMKMLFGNLIANAVNYSYDGGAVRVQGKAFTPEGAEVCVADEGIGIPAEKLSRIFEDHYRTEEAAQHNRASTGLGLAIVRHVAHLEGLDVRVESAPEKGTTFTVTIPHRDVIKEAGGKEA